MAPPRTRRPGYSRRIQLSLFLSYVLAIIGAVTALALALIARFDPAGYTMLRGVATDASAPFSAAGRAVVRGLESVDQSISAYFFAASKNGAMQDELDRARRALIEAKAIKAENLRLKRTLGLVEPQTNPIVTARLIGSTAMSPRRFATLSAGSRNGIVPGLPVLSADGLIGRTLDTGRTASRIMLLTDAESTVPVRVTRNGTPALAMGAGNGTVSVRPLLPGAATFRRGDLLVTSGTGGIYPPNVPVAVIARANRNGAIAWPLAHPERIDFAIVTRPYQPPVPLPAPPDAEKDKR